MTMKLTPDQLDEIEAAARAEVGARAVPPRIDQLGRVRREWEAFLKVATPITVLALVAEVRELRAKVERVREVHEPIDALLNPGRHERVVKVCIGCGTDDGNWQRYPCPTIRALGEEA